MSPQPVKKKNTVFSLILSAWTPVVLLSGPAVCKAEKYCLYHVWLIGRYACCLPLFMSIVSTSAWFLCASTFIKPHCTSSWFIEKANKHNQHSLRPSAWCWCADACQLLHSSLAAWMPVCSRNTLPLREFSSLPQISVRRHLLIQRGRQEEKCAEAEKNAYKGKEYRNCCRVGRREGIPLRQNLSEPFHKSTWDTGCLIKTKK